MFDSFDDFEPLDFLNLAEELSIMENDFNSSESSVKRNIYGRIYYAIFLYVRWWLSNNTDYVSYAPGEHSRLPNYIKTKGPFDRCINQEISDNLMNLKKLRHQSDYYLELPNKFSKSYENWVFTDIDGAFAIANDIIGYFSDK